MRSFMIYSSPNIVWVIKLRRMRWEGHVAQMGEERGVYRVLVWKPEEKRPLGRPRHRWEDNIRMDLQKVGCGGMDWIGLAQDRDRWRTIVNAVMNHRVQQNAGNFLTSYKPVSFSRTLLHGVSKSLSAHTEFTLAPDYPKCSLELASNIKYGYSHLSNICFSNSTFSGIPLWCSKKYSNQFCNRYNF
jgi:hypothetical protein